MQKRRKIAISRERKCEFVVRICFYTFSRCSNRVVVNSRDVLACFANHRLHLVLQGHLHVNEMLRWRGTTFITGGAVSGKWWRGPWHGTDAGFGVLTLRPDRVDWDYKEIGWVPRRP